MRRHDYFVVAQQRVLSGRLFAEHVDGGTGDAAVVERANQGRLIDQLTAGRVNDAHPGLHLREVFIVDQVARLGRQSDVEADDVSLCKHFILGDQLHAEALSLFRRDVRVVRDDAHVHTSDAAGHLRCDVP